MRVWRKLLLGLLSFCVFGWSPGTPARGAPISPPRIILFIGDGMGEVHRTAARWFSAGQEGTLAMDALPEAGWARTSAANGAVTDSAAAGTALATGIKTNNGFIGMDPQGNVLVTILAQAQARGLAVGLVSTTQMAHATPASFAAHVSSRTMMNEIADQILARGVDVLLAGGEDEFLPLSATGCYPERGERLDGRNLIDAALSAGYSYICDSAGFAAVDPAPPPRLLGLFADEGMTRPYSPTLAMMTQTALDVLSQDPDGFFLMVEGGQIDWAAHDNDAANVIGDVLGLDEAVAVAKTFAASAPGTLIIVTADHETGGMQVTLEPTGAFGEDGPFAMPDGTPFYVTWSSTSHTGADVPVTALGMGAGLLAGSYENTVIYNAMRFRLLGRSLYLPVILRFAFLY